MDLSIQKISNEKAITYKIVDLIESYSFNIFFFLSSVHMKKLS